MRLLLILSMALSNCLAAAQTQFEIVIRNGRIIDGTGNPAFHADLGIANGKINRIGLIPEKGNIELDAKGLIIAPGFIDVHSHAENVLELPEAENFVRMGVTTIVAGNCGYSTTNVAEFLAGVEKAQTTANVATLAGHGTIRALAMNGSFNRPPTPDELSRMQQLTEQAMKAGAVGLSTGLIYLPGTFAKTEEIITLARIVASFGGVYASHMRNEGVEIFSALDELFAIARQAGIRAHISHIKLSSEAAWGRAHEVLRAIETARASGLDITQDQYLYTASSTGISQLIPEQAREGGLEQFRARLSNPQQKAQIIAKMKENLARRGRDDYAYAVIANFKGNPKLNGKNIVEAAQLIRGSSTLDDQIETILQIQSDGGASGIFHGINENDLRIFLQHPNTMIAADSSVREFGEGVPHPRGYGNNARLLKRYVRENSVLRLEDAIRKMTSLPATTFQLKGRGLVQEGHWADLVLFNPDNVTDRATFSDPHQYAVGFQWVLVNGEIVAANDELTGARPGHALRHFHQN